MSQAEVKRKQALALSEILIWMLLPALGKATGSLGVTCVMAAVEALLPLWLLVSGGVSDALGRMLRARNNKSQYKNAARLRRCVLVFQLALGAAGSLLLLLSAELLMEKFFRVRYSALILMVLSPILFLRTLSAVLLGFLQGEGTELPTAVSALLRPLLVLGFGLVFAEILKGYGDKVSGLLKQEKFTAVYGGAGIALGINAAELFILLLLVILYARGRRRDKAAGQENGMRTVDSLFDCVRTLGLKRWQTAVPGLLLYLPLPIGWLFFEKAVKEENAALTQYGVYAGQYLPVCGMVTAAVALAAIPVTAKVCAALKKEEQRLARTAFGSGLHICLVHGIYGAVFIAVMWEQLARLVSDDASAAAGSLLQGGSLLILFGALAGYFARFLYRIDRRYPLFGALALGDVIFMIVSALLLNVGKAGILALAYGGLAASGLLAVGLGMLVFSALQTKPDWLRQLILPLLAGAGAGLVCILVKKLLGAHLGSLAVLLIALVLSGAVYWAVLLAVRDFREQELEYIPGGKILYALGEKLHIF